MLESIWTLQLDPMTFIMALAVTGMPSVLLGLFPGFGLFRGFRPLCGSLSVMTTLLPSLESASMAGALLLKVAVASRSTPDLCGTERPSPCR